ncbi:MAG TPA: hypothetical protein VLI40_08025, partial [Gemmatimonadaceae bacterium]|nr:hypothetical protein [Gemmatimonadaceae bacterium]
MKPNLDFAATGSSARLTPPITIVPDVGWRMPAIMQGGTLRAVGTMDELRAGDRDARGLEDIFLRLTGETAARSALDAL